MTFQSDSRGFLVGTPLSGDLAERLLSGIKGDTGRILAMMRAQGAAVARLRAGQGQRVQRGAPTVPTVTPAGRGGSIGGQAARLAPMAATVAPAGRAAATRGATAVRDPATGRFVSAAAGPSPAAAGQRMAEVADAAQKVARSVEQQRRDAKADKAAEKTPKAPKADRGGGMLPSAGSAAAAAEASQQIDPLLQSIGETVEFTKNSYAIAAKAASVSAAVASSPLKLARWMQRDKMPEGAYQDASGRWRDKDGKYLKKNAKEQTALLKRIADLMKSRAMAGGGVFGGDQGGGGGGGGLWTMLGGGLAALMAGKAGGGVLGKLFGKFAAPAAAPAADTLAKVGAKGLLKRVPIVGPLIDAVAGAIKDRDLANDKSLTDEERTRLRVGNAVETGGAMGGGIAGAMAGAAALSFLGPLGVLAGGVGGGFLGSEAGRKAMGWVSKRFESGAGGAGTISTGRGDAGGKSYGTHQLSSNTGTLGRFLASTPYGAQFAGLKPGSAEFDAQWRRVAASDPSFGKAQQDFITRRHFDPLMAKLKGSGMDLSVRGEAVREAVFSTATQFGPDSSVVQNALKGRDMAGMSDAAIVAAIQDYKIANNDSLFRSSSAAVRDGTLSRAMQERAALLSVAAATPNLPAIPRPGAMPVQVAPGPMPQPELPTSTRSAGGGRSVVQLAAAPTSQDVRDRTLAHIVTGGIGGSIAHR